ncbi:MAG: Cardiolipin synthase C [Kerstersia gyiorum]|uniref:phospholipase D family protein n=1 Tax=Kerstersia gyiorum TaxID=206506 RepID=UPI0030D51731
MLRSGIAIIAAGLMSSCGLPPLDNRSESQATMTQEGLDTRLGQSLAPLAAQHPGLSGVLPLTDSLDAFAARILLIAAAERSVDVQYYIWRDDITGNLLLRALHDAAQRKVRVRLLLDDNGTNGLDSKLALLNAEPNVEVRLFNPFPFRVFKPLGFLTDFRRLNRRMHNKSLTVDGQATIVGGRNIGDEYFGATQAVAFADLDVLVTGPAVNAVSLDFDRYWNSPSAYPLEQLISPPGSRKTQALLQDEANAALVPKAHAYVQAITQSRFIENLHDGQLAFLWAPVRLVSDDPAKALGQASPDKLLMARLADVLGTPNHSVDLISPYFVPTSQGVEAFGKLAEQGVHLRVLTNAMEATDVLAVHAGYAKYRVPLLEQGVELYELRRNSDSERPREKAGPFGSSGSSLHAKTFAVDGERVFVGSFNFDPRSAQLNTELGFVIESAALAQAMSQAFDHSVPHYAYQLELDDKHEIAWLEQGPDGVIRHTSEPSTSFWKRTYLRLLSILPIEPLL